MTWLHLERRELLTPDRDVIIVKQEIKTLNMSEAAIEGAVVGTVGRIYEMADRGMTYVPSG